MTFTTSGLAEEKKLVWAGLRRAQQDTSVVVGEFNRLANNVGDYSTFKADLDSYDSGIDNFTEFKTYLEDSNKGDFTTAQADAFIDKIKDSFTDEDSSGSTYDEFEDAAEAANSYDELKNQFGTSVSLSYGETADGERVAGIRVIEGGGVTYAGVTTSVTTTEIFGRRIEFSQQEAGRAEDGSITFSNLTTDDADNVLNVGSTVQISVDVQNSNTGERSVSVALTRDGSVVQEKTVTVPGSTTKTVNFDQSEDEYGCWDFTVADLSPITICWTPPGLTPV